MDRLYIVRAADGRGILGTLTDREMRRRLSAGVLSPRCECLPAHATGDLTRQWRPVWVALGLAEPGPNDGVPAPAAPPSEVRDTPPTPGPALARFRSGPLKSGSCYSRSDRSCACSRARARSCTRRSFSTKRFLTRGGSACRRPQPFSCWRARGAVSHSARRCSSYSAGSRISRSVTRRPEPANGADAPRSLAARGERLTSRASSHTAWSASWRRRRTWWGAPSCCNTTSACRRPACRCRAR